METKTHFKMYKDGCRWVIAGLTTMAVGLTIGLGSTTIAHAATTNDTVVDSVTTETTLAQVASSSQSETDPTASTDVVQDNQAASPEVKSTSEPAAHTTPVTNDDERQAALAITPKATIPDQTVVDQSQIVGTAVAINDEQSAPIPSQAPTTDDPGKPTATPTTTSEVQSVTEPQGDDATTVATTDMATDSPLSSAESTELTNVVKATDLFNVPKVGNLQWSFNHPSLSDVIGQNAWQGADYAAGIATTATGIDPQTGALYLDEWMPDEIFQYFLYTNNYTDQYATFGTFRSQFTKDTLAQMTSLASSEAAQHVGNYQNLGSLTNYMSLMSMGSLEGLQYATNLTSINLHPSTEISQEVFGNIAQNGNLWDISALASLTKLQSVTISTFSITDISALADKPELTFVDLMYNQIADMSPLATDAKLKAAYLRFQHLLLTPITLRTGTTTYTTPSFIIKDLQANNLPVLAFDPQSDEYPSLFPSTADGGNLDDVTLTWSNILPDTATNYGSFTTTWSNLDANFEGWIIQPYILKDGIGNVTVNYQLLQADGQQLSVYPTSVLAGDVDTTFDLNTNATVAQALQVIMGDKGLDFSGLILTGSGQNSDYLAENGLAERAGVTGTYTADTQTLTILFLKKWQVQVNYGVLSADDHSVAAIMGNNGQPLQQTINANLSTTIALHGDNGIVANLPGYIFAGVEISSPGSDWTPVAADASQIPFIDGSQSVLVLYRIAQTATVNYVDETTGQVLKTVTSTEDPTLTGITGATSLYQSQPEIEAYEQQGYQLVSDETVDANGQSLIIFGDTGQPVMYQVTLAHTYQAGAVQTVTRTINYVNKSGQVVADPKSQAVTFVSVLDQTTPTTPGTSYYYLGATQQAPALTVTGQPSDPNWILGRNGTFVSVMNPIIPTYEVVDTTSTKQDLTQTPERSVTVQDGDSVETVTYDFIQGQVGELPAMTTLTIVPVDRTGQTLQAAVAQSGLQNTEFTVTAPIIDGYRLIDPQQQTISGTYRGNQMTLMLAYDLMPIETVPTTVQLTINYVDRLGETIAPSTIQHGGQGEPFSITVPTIDGYRPVDSQQSEISGTYHGNVMTLTLRYEPKPVEVVPSAVTLTINYVDRSGDEIAPATTQSGTQGEPFSVNAPAIDNYRLVDAQQSVVNGTYHGNVITLTLRYEPKPVEAVASTATLTINYVDRSGDEIAPATMQSGTQGEPFSINAPTIDGYRLVDAQKSVVNGTYHGNVMMLTLMYEPKPTEAVASAVTLTINYVDRLGNVIAPATQQRGAQGTAFELAIPTVAGYRPVDFQQSVVSGTYQGDVMTLTLMYEPEPIEVVATTVQLTVNYVDQHGQSIATTTHDNGIQGTAFSVIAPTIVGYQLVDPNQQVISGTYHGNQMTLTLTYQPKPTTSATTLSGNSVVSGETVTTSPVIKTQLNTDPTLTGTLQLSPPESTIVPVSEKTTKNGPMAGSITPVPSEQQLVNTQRKLPKQRVTETVIKQPTSPANARSATAAKLPQTSERVTSKGALIGASLLAILSGLGWYLKLRRKHD